MWKWASAVNNANDKYYDALLYAGWKLEGKCMETGENTDADLLDADR